MDGEKKGFASRKGAKGAKIREQDKKIENIFLSRSPQSSQRILEND